MSAVCQGLKPRSFVVVPPWRARVCGGRDPRPYGLGKQTSALRAGAVAISGGGGQVHRFTTPRTKLASCGQAEARQLWSGRSSPVVVRQKLASCGRVEHSPTHLARKARSMDGA